MSSFVSSIYVLVSFNSVHNPFILNKTELLPETNQNNKNYHKSTIIQLTNPSSGECIRPTTSQSSILYASVIQRSKFKSNIKNPYKTYNIVLQLTLRWVKSNPWWEYVEFLWISASPAHAASIVSRRH